MVGRLEKQGRLKPWVWRGFFRFLNFSGFLLDRFWTNRLIKRVCGWILDEGTQRG